MGAIETIFVAGHNPKEGVCQVLAGLPSRASGTKPTVVDEHVVLSSCTYWILHVGNGEQRFLSVSVDEVEIDEVSISELRSSAVPDDGGPLVLIYLFPGSGKACDVVVVGIELAINFCCFYGSGIRDGCSILSRSGRRSRAWWISVSLQSEV